MYTNNSAGLGEAEDDAAHALHANGGSSDDDGEPDPNADTVPDNEPVNDGNGPWACVACTFKNSLASDQCSICMTPKPAADGQDSAALAAQAATDAVEAVVADTTAAAEEKWRSPSGTPAAYGSDAMYCRPGAAAPEAAAAATSSRSSSLALDTTMKGSPVATRKGRG